MKPVSDFTTPRKLIAPMSRHFFPVEQPEPCCWTTGLKNGSRLPLIAHFFSSGFGAGFAAGVATAGAVAGAATLASTTVFASCFGVAFVAGAPVFGASVLATVFLGSGFTDGAFGAGSALATVCGSAAGLDSFLAGAVTVFATSDAPPCACRVSTSLPD